MVKKRRPPATRIIRETLGFLTVKEAAARLRLRETSLYPHLRRGSLPIFYKRGGQSCTGWTTYLRESDVEAVRSQAQPIDPLSISEAAKLLRVTRSSLTPYLNSGRLTRYTRQFGKGKKLGRVMLERAQVEQVMRERQHKTEKPLPPAMAKLLKQDLPRPKLIARLLGEKPKGISDARIARAVGVSKQRVSEIKQKLKPR